MTEFSIFLPVRNGWPQLKRCVESILAQTYVHFELNILNNQSTDGTNGWLQTLRHPRIHIYNSSSSLSIEESWARINGLEKKEFMTVIGHDDELDRGFLAAVEALIDHHPNAGLYQTGARFIDANGVFIRDCRPIPERETAADYLRARFSFTRDVFGTGYVMRSKDYDSLGGIPAFERLFFADDALWLSLIRGSYKATDPRPLCSVGLHVKSESASVPAAWRSLLLGLGQFSRFLGQFMSDDPAVLDLIVDLAPAFLLRYHRNVYIYALIEACQKRRKISPDVITLIESSLRDAAPAVSQKLRSNLKVRLIESLSGVGFRRQVLWLWNVYWTLRNVPR